MLAVVVAAALSGVFPIGPAATAEPAPGFSLNLAWLGLGGVLIVVLLVAVSAGPTWRATRLRWSEGARAGHPYRVVEAVAHGGASPAAVVGVGMAIGTVPGRRSFQRLSLAGSVVAVSLLVGAVVFGASLHHLLDVPVSYGWRWDAVVSMDASDHEPTGAGPAVPGHGPDAGRDR